ncbi:MAG: acyltransferase [Paludibacteraceae bacterium]|nr:acyltransferase [Paludibacteraceae bacterium]
MKGLSWLYRRWLYGLTRAQGRNVRVWAMRKLGFEIGQDVYIGPGLTMTIGYSDTNIKLNLGDRVSFGPNVTLILATHPNNSKLRSCIKYPARQITIGDDTWLGANVVIMPNITIGKCCIIGAGAVVTHDVPDYAIMAGVPAKKIGEVDKESIK